MNQAPSRVNRIEKDMSPEALDLRVRELAQLYKLGVALRDARLLGPVEELRRLAETGDWKEGSGFSSEQVPVGHERHEKHEKDRHW